jgi:hypothetical protein
MWWWIWAGAWWLACGGLTPSASSVLEDEAPSADDSDAVVSDDVEEDPEDTEIWDTSAGDVVQDTDVAGDTDVPDSPPEDTDAPPTPPSTSSDPNGVYTGSFRLRWFTPFNAADQLCEGPVVVTVDTTASPSVTASFACDWAGFLPGVAEIAGYSALQGQLTGSVRSNNQAAATGDLWASDMADFDERADWTGAFSGDQFSLEYDARVPIVGGGIKGSFTLQR